MAILGAGPFVDGENFAGFDTRNGEVYAEAEFGEGRRRDRGDTRDRASLVTTIGLVSTSDRLLSSQDRAGENHSGATGETLPFRTQSALCGAAVGEIGGVGKRGEQAEC